MKKTSNVKFNKAMETKHKKFKAFDKVLVRDVFGWRPDIYSEFTAQVGKHLCLGSTYLTDEHILPYEGNEHLVGTIDEPEEEVKLKGGEWCVFFDNIERVVNGTSGSFKKFKKSSNNWLLDYNNLSWDYAIRLSDFNPNDMEETKKHILCVKNGKVVKYKG